MKLRAGDFITAAAIIAIAVFIWLYPNTDSVKSEYAEISQGGKLISRVKLSDDGEIELSGCVLEVSDGKIRMKQSDCPDKVCVKTGEISRAGESIVCVPNKVSVEISGSDGNGADVIAG